MLRPTAPMRSRALLEPSKLLRSYFGGVASLVLRGDRGLLYVGHQSGGPNWSHHARSPSASVKRFSRTRINNLTLRLVIPTR
jgi:hypothetical protein